ncbi:MAG: DNA primase small subunit PriS [Candidatus Diapherotrites archaeon]|nr:DNA primase small subunit PriS [Candidatus Diapherotrites archaeon]
MANEQPFLKSHFRDFYLKNDMPLVPEIEKREFGIGAYGKKIVRRHLAFDSARELKDFLVVNVPLYVSVSVGYYSNSHARTMNAKGWSGADLIFEFDADDLPTNCKEKHDFWECPSCKAKGHGLKKACTECGSKTLVEMWFCDECLQAAKDDTFKLVDDFLKADFGFSSKDISINASGNRGYHIYTRNKAVRELNKDAIIELSNYVTAKGLDPQFHRLRFQGRVLHGPKTSLLGWSGRLSRAVQSYLREVDPEVFAADFGFGIRKARTLLGDRGRLIAGVDRGYWDQFKLKNLDSVASAWERIAARAAVTSSAEIDTQVTVDVKKLMRLPGSLHGSTGLVAAQVSNLESFDPLKDTIAFKSGSVKVSIKRAPEFRLGDEVFGPFQNASIELPTAAAVFLIARGAAVLAE